MATIDLGRLHDPHIGHTLLVTLHSAWLAHRRRRAERRILAQVARLGPRLIADAGFDPDTVRGTTGEWDRLDPAGLRLLLPHRRRESR